MKKLVIGLTALFVASMVASNASAALSSKKATFLNFNITFAENPQTLLLDIYDDATLETSDHKLNDKTLALSNNLVAVTNTRKMLLRTYVKIQPKGLYEVAIYTNNLDKNNDGIIDATATVPVDLNGDSEGDISLPANWNSMTVKQKAGFVGGWAGLYHSQLGKAILPIKVWTPVTAGKLTDVQNDTRTESIAPPLIYSGKNQVPDPAPAKLINDWAWFGNSKTTESDNDAYYTGSYGYIPEKLAIDEAKGTLGSYSKIIAGTAYGTDVTKKQEITFGVDQLFAGSGIYKGKVYLDLRGN